MSDVTRILSQINDGDPQAAEQLLPLVYDELRKLAAVRLAQEKPGQTLQATALVHEAYIRLVDVDKVQHWDSQGHFFAAAAEAMRRILVDSALRKRTRKHGGDFPAAGSPRVHAGERHLHPMPPRAAWKPPRSRGGSITFTVLPSTLNRGIGWLGSSFGSPPTF